MFLNGRKITVDGNLFYYKITGCVNLVVQRASDGVKKTYHEEWKRKWRSQFTPKMVEQFIRKSFAGIAQM